MESPTPPASRPPRGERAPSASRPGGTGGPARPPPELLALVPGRKVVEVGAGSAFDTALAFAAAGARPVLVTDVRDDVLRAPAPLDAAVDDITRPSLALYLDAALVYGVRLPEELQVSVSLVAETVGAVYAVRPLKDELAEVPMGGPRVLPGGWRAYGL